VAGSWSATALFGGGADGLDLPRHVVAAAVRLLRPGGLFVMEHADVQGETVRDLIDRTGAFEPAVTHRDLTGRDRFVLARRRPT
jgi:release factor glutamine methyltransferase